MRERIRIGVLGAGHMGRLHAGVLRGCEEAELVAIADAAPELAQAAAGQFGCRAAGSLDEFRQLGIAAVYLCTPNTTHADLAVAALEAGLHVFCEKPLATTLADAERVRRVAAAG
ncbi:MAG: Gfo/Idh/MocA family oxidoreductase, partial [Chloroflexi bacterium]|nr:Gfo/Idh/MocA family oxidoreductase [Chloroflexota bacterium]